MCENCGHSQGEDVDIAGETYHLCDSCVSEIHENIENEWYDFWTDDHHEAVLEYLEARDDVWCVHGHKEVGEYWIHTPYVNSIMIEDLNTCFDMSIYGVQLVKPESYDGEFDCVYEHGPCIEFNIDAPTETIPLPPRALPCPDDGWQPADVQRLDYSGALFSHYNSSQE